MIGYLFAIALTGLVIGALGRLIVPGHQQMGCVATMGAGIAGSVVGGLIGRVIFGPNYAPGLIMSTLAAAGLIAVFTRSQQRSYR